MIILDVAGSSRSAGVSLASDYLPLGASQRFLTIFVQLILYFVCWLVGVIDSNLVGCGLLVVWLVYGLLI